MVTPPGKDGKPNPDILAAALVAGVDRVFLVGGAQAVAALAFGTESIPKVDKIVGPGNIYVATAKRQLYGTVDIDMIAGPSEILILADDTANPGIFGSGPDVPGGTRSAGLFDFAHHIRRVGRGNHRGTVDRQIEGLSRKDIINQSLDNFGAVMLSATIWRKRLSLPMQLAPEHLEVCAANPMEFIGKIDNAGSVFLGQLVAGTAGRLLCRAEPCASHQRDGALFLPAFGGQLCQKVQLHLLYAGRLDAGKGGYHVSSQRRRA